MRLMTWNYSTLKPVVHLQSAFVIPSLMSVAVLVGFIAIISAAAIATNRTYKPKNSQIQVKCCNETQKFVKRGSLCSLPLCIGDSTLKSASKDVHFLPRDEVFKFKLECEPLNKIQCKLALFIWLIRASMKSAGIRIASQLLFRRSIMINVKFRYFKDKGLLAANNFQPWICISKLM